LLELVHVEVVEFGLVGDYRTLLSHQLGQGAEDYRLKAFDGVTTPTEGDCAKVCFTKGSRGA
jgi:hypothetical protein